MIDNHVSKRCLILIIFICITLAVGIAVNAKDLGIDPKGHSDEISTVCFTPDGKLLITGSYDGKAKLWDASTGTHVCDLAKRENQITAASVDPNGKIVAITDTCGVIELRDLTTGKQLKTLPSNINFPDVLTFVSDQKMIIGSYDRVKLLSVTTGKQLKEIMGKSVVVTTNLKTLAKCSGKGRVSLINQASGKQITSLAADEPRLFNFNGTVLATVTSEAEADQADPTSTVKLWDTATGRLLSQVACSGGILTFNHQGNQILIVDGGFLSSVHLINVKDGKCSLTVDSRQYFASSGAFSQDGKRVAIGGANGGVIVWDTVKNARICDIKGSKPATYEGELEL